MSYQVLARKWRPQQFQQVIGQEAIVRTLQNALVSQRVGHAYLFTGTRGVGKTSVARLFAKALLCQNPKSDGNPCDVCEACNSFKDGSTMDFLEIDGASNNSVENIRQLIDNVQYLPTKGDYKIYVIDEVHMLSISAFNALLKTLEEPPVHVVFLFATTEPEKIPQTILSRCQRFDFKNVLPHDVSGHLKKIAQAEGITFENDEIVDVIAQKGDGSLRDSLSLMDQVLALSDGKNISEETLIQSLGVARLSAIKELVTAILEGHLGSCSKIYSQIIEENVEVKNVAAQILDHFFYIIQNIDEPAKIYEKKLVREALLTNISISELFWIYEGLNRDFDWALRSLNPIKVVEVVLKKYTLRKTILKSTDLMIDRGGSKKKVVQKPKTWEGFLTHLQENVAGVHANLERGNIVEKPIISENSFYVSYGFAEDNKVFYDFFQEKESFTKLSGLIANFFEIEEENVRVNLKLISIEEKEDKNFVSQVEKAEKKIQEQEDANKESLLSNLNIKKLEAEFNTKVDKVILNK